MIAFIDIETGGFSKEKNALCEIGLVIADNDLNILQEWQTYIKPYARLDSVELCSYKEDAMKVNGITMEQLESGMHITDALIKLNNLLFGLKMIGGHNVVFDLTWLCQLSLRYRYHWKAMDDIICTLQMAKKHLSGSHSLDDICDSLGIHKEGHTALGDAKASLELYKYLKMNYGC